MLQDPSLRAPIAIALGAIVGALSRYYITVGVAQWLGTPVYGTLLVNLAGAWTMGFFTTWIVWRAAIPQELALLVGTGFLGSLTTFSTYALETVSLVRGQPPWVALIYWLGSAVFGVISLYAGMLTARFLQ